MERLKKGIMAVWVLSFGFRYIFVLFLLIAGNLLYCSMVGFKDGASRLGIRICGLKSELWELVLFLPEEDESIVSLVVFLLC